MKIESADTHLILEDILVGEVWLASGQSNMQWPVSASNDADAEIAAAVDDLTLSELQRAFELLDDRPPAGRVALRLAQKSMDLGEYDEASHDLKVAGGLSLGESERTLQEELSLRLEFYQSRLGDELFTILPGRSSRTARMSELHTNGLEI